MICLLKAVLRATKNVEAMRRYFYSLVGKNRFLAVSV
jgi:hypothetical protein